MFDRQKYIEYLSGTRKGNETINEYIKTLDNFRAFIREHNEANPQIDNCYYSGIEKRSMGE